MSVKMRQEVERKIAKALVKESLAAGYEISVDNGEGEGPKRTDAKAILAEMFLTDEEHLYMWKDGRRFGWVFLVYGNDGWDVISDYTVNLQHQVGSLFTIALRLREDFLHALMEPDVEGP